MKFKSLISKILVIVVCGWASVGFSNEDAYGRKYYEIGELNGFSDKKKWRLAIFDERVAIALPNNKNLIRSVIPAVILIRECYKNRKGYASVYINEVEYSRYKKRARQLAINTHVEYFRMIFSKNEWKGIDELLEFYRPNIELYGEGLLEQIEKGASNNREPFLRTYYPMILLTSNWNSGLRDVCQFTFSMFVNEAKSFYGQIPNVDYHVNGFPR